MILFLSKELHVNASSTLFAFFAATRIEPITLATWPVIGLLLATPGKTFSTPFMQSGSPHYPRLTGDARRNPPSETINFFSVSVGREIIYLIFLGSLTYLRLDGDSPGTSNQSTHKNCKQTSTQRRKCVKMCSSQDWSLALQIS